jgi:hypothetical protein
MCSANALLSKGNSFAQILGDGRRRPSEVASELPAQDLMHEPNSGIEWIPHSYIDQIKGIWEVSPPPTPYMA